MSSSDALGTNCRFVGGLKLAQQFGYGHGDNVNVDNAVINLTSEQTKMTQIKALHQFQKNEHKSSRSVKS